jgi:hypothetical protein
VLCAPGTSTSRITRALPRLPRSVSVAQPGSFLVLVLHGRGLWIRGAHPEIRYSPVAPPNYFPLLATGLRNPTVLAHVLVCQR